MKYMILILLSIVVLTGCYQNSGKSSGSYPSAVVWNNNLYAFSALDIPAQDIGKKLGKIERRISPMPKKNGDSNDKPVGSLIFEVKGTDINEAIAVKVNEKYYRASKLQAVENINQG